MLGKESPIERMHWGEGSSQDQATVVFFQAKNVRATAVGPVTHWYGEGVFSLSSCLGEQCNSVSQAVIICQA